MSIEIKGWTGARLALLEKFVEEGLTASQIAARLDCGLSRNAVIGMIDRRGLRLARGRGCLEAVGKKREVQARHRRDEGKKTDLPRGEAGCFAKHPGKIAPAPQRALSTIPDAEWVSQPSAKKEQDCQPTEPQNLPLIELELGQCRYATGFDGKSRRHLFCGMAVREDSPYCPAHHEISYHKISRAHRQASDRAAVHHGQIGTIVRPAAKWAEA